MDEEMEVEEKVNDNVESGKDEPHQINILDLSNEVLLKIFAELGYDDLQVMVYQCRRIAQLVRPMLWQMRKDCLAIMQPHILKSKRLIGQSEKYLKRVLRTNEDLTGLAYNLPIERTPNGNEKPKDWLAILLGFYNEQDYFELQHRANELMKIAREDCKKVTDVVDRAFLQFTASLSSNEDNQIGPETMEQLRKRVYFLIFEKFMRKYPGLCKFTSVQWPEEMAEEQRDKLSKEYATRNMANSGHPEPKTQGRMYEMREKGKLIAANSTPMPSSSHRFQDFEFQPRIVNREVHPRFVDLEVEWDDCW